MKQFKPGNILVAKKNSNIILRFIHYDSGGGFENYFTAEVLLNYSNIGNYYPKGNISGHWYVPEFELHTDLTRLRKLERIFNNETL